MEVHLPKFCTYDSYKHTHDNDPLLVCLPNGDLFDNYYISRPTTDNNLSLTITNNAPSSLRIPAGSIIGTAYTTTICKLPQHDEHKPLECYQVEVEDDSVTKAIASDLSLIHI